MTVRRIVVVALALGAGAAIAGDDPRTDPRTTAEDGWQAYLQHDLARAEALTRDAIAHAGNNTDLRGAALYNLGRILEDRGDKPGAIVTYRESLTARRTWVVRDRLRALDRAAAESFDPYEPSPMKGPFPSLDAFCRGNLLEIYPNDEQSRLALESGCDAIQSVTDRPLKVAAPVQALRVVRVPEIPQRMVAAQVGGVWYVAPIDPFEDPPNCGGDVKVTGATARPGRAIQLGFTIDGGCSHHDVDWTWSERGFVVLGVGASNQPSMTSPFHLAITETDTTEGKPHRQTMNQQRSATWTKDGAIDIAVTRNVGSTVRASADELADLTGHHTLTFP